MKNRHMGRARRKSEAALIIAALVTAGGCSGGLTSASGPQPQPQQVTAFAFVANLNSNTVSAFQMDSTGALSTVAGSPFATDAGPEFLAADASGKFLFVGNSGTNTVSAFQINATTGALTAVPGSPFSSGARPEGVVVDPQGRFVFVGNQAANSISVFSIGSSGALTQVAGSPFAAPSPFGLAVNAAGTVLFANNFPDSTGFDLNTVSAFQIGPSGTLTKVTGSPFATANSSGFASSVGLAADHSGKFLFVGDHMAQAVVPFAVDATSGALTPAQNLPAPAASCNGVSCHNNPLRVAVHPNDQFVYASNVQAGTISAFSVLGSGALSPISEFPAGQHPFGMALDPKGGFLYVVNKVDNTISGFRVDSANGMLSALSGSPFGAGGNGPVNIVIVSKP